MSVSFQLLNLLVASLQQQKMHQQASPTQKKMDLNVKGSLVHEFLGYVFFFVFLPWGFVVGGFVRRRFRRETVLQFSKHTNSLGLPPTQ